MHMTPETIFINQETENFRYIIKNFILTKNIF